MADENVVAGADFPSLAIRKIGVADLKDALAKGYGDFIAMPSHAVLLCVIYPIIGIILVRFISGRSLLPMLFPVMTGFALIGPFAAIALYELSRRRELGMDTSPSHISGVIRSPGNRSLAALGAILLIIFIFWLETALAIYHWTLDGATPTGIFEFVEQIFTTRGGWSLIILGNVAGFLFAVAVFSLSVVSFPLVLDRHVDAITAVTTSLRSVAANPKIMALWGFIIASTLALSALPLFIGLIVSIPILGHASWHLYRKVVAP